MVEITIIVKTKHGFKGTRIWEHQVLEGTEEEALRRIQALIDDRLAALSLITKGMKESQEGKTSDRGSFKSFL